MEKSKTSLSEGMFTEVDEGEKIILTTTEKEMIRAITGRDYAYFQDLGGLEYNINFKISPEGINPLLLASSIGDVAIIQMIMANQHVRMNHTDNKGENAIFYAVGGGHMKALKELRKRGVPMTISKVTGGHPAHLACSKGYLEMVEYFITEVGLDANIAKKNGINLLMTACIKNHPDITRFLLETGADPNVKLDNGVTALYLAAKYGSHLSVEFLLQCKVEVDAVCDNSQSTPLMAAVENGHVACCKKLLIAKANPNICNANGEDVYVLASISPNVEVLKLILSLYISKGNEIDKESPLDKMSMFMRACFTENHKNAKYLKRKGAKVNFKNSEGDTILHIALRNKNHKVIAFCLFIGCNKKIENDKGESFEKFAESGDKEYLFLKDLEKKVEAKLVKYKKEKFRRSSVRKTKKTERTGTLQVPEMGKGKRTELSVDTIRNDREEEDEE